MDGDNLVTAKINDLLDCDSFRPFWVGWRNATIDVGRGNVPYQDSIMAYEDASPYSVGHVGLSTGKGAVGTWDIKRGGCRKYKTDVNNLTLISHAFDLGPRSRSN